MKVICKSVLLCSIDEMPDCDHDILHDKYYGDVCDRLCKINNTESYCIPCSEDHLTVYMVKARLTGTPEIIPNESDL